MMVLLYLASIAFLFATDAPYIIHIIVATLCAFPAFFIACVGVDTEHPTGFIALLAMIGLCLPILGCITMVYAIVRVFQMYLL